MLLKTRWWLTVLCCAAMPSWAAVPGYITAAVADASRLDADLQRDANRKPAEVLAFAGVKPGDKVGELMPGGGYFTRLFCKVVAEQGHVYTMDFTRVVPINRPPPKPVEPHGKPCANISSDTKPAAEFALPTGLDLVWTSENYHDLYNKGFGQPDMIKFNRAIFAALKAGGVYMVEDHAAAPGTDARDTESLHRIDPEQVKKDLLAAGFVLEASSDVLRNAEDPHTARAHELQGRSDKFLLKFRKPVP